MKRQESQRSRHASAPKLRYVKRRLALEHSWPHARALLDGLDFVALDVGAANGVLGHWQWLEGFANLVLVDPRETACRDLEAMYPGRGGRPAATVVCAAVSNVDGERTLYVSNVPTGTSLFKPEFASCPDLLGYLEPDYFFPLKEEPISTRTLSSIFTQAGIAHVELAKLDIQGAELEALQGLGPDLLGTLLGVELEINMASFYAGAPTFNDIQEFMRKHGLDLFDVRTARARLLGPKGSASYEERVFEACENPPGIASRVWEFDALYFRSRHEVLERGQSDTVRRLAMSYMAYNYFAEAHELVAAAAHRGILTTVDANRLQELIVNIYHVREHQPRYGRGRFWRWFNRLTSRLSPRNGDRWAQYTNQPYPHS